jgi:hypothetical protein
VLVEGRLTGLLAAVVVGEADRHDAVRVVGGLVGGVEVGRFLDEVTHVERALTTRDAVLVGVEGSVGTIGRDVDGVAAGVTEGAADRPAVGRERDAFLLAEAGLFECAALWVVLATTARELALIRASLYRRDSLPRTPEVLMAFGPRLRRSSL